MRNRLCIRTSVCAYVCIRMCLYWCVHVYVCICIAVGALTTMMMITMINSTCLYAYVNIVANLNESDATPKLTFEINTAALDGI